jgi:hypothetical protein
MLYCSKAHVDHRHRAQPEDCKSSSKSLSKEQNNAGKILERCGGLIWHGVVKVLSPLYALIISFLFWIRKYVLFSYVFRQFRMKTGFTPENKWSLLWICHSVGFFFLFLRNSIFIFWQNTFHFEKRCTVHFTITFLKQGYIKFLFHFHLQQLSFSWWQYFRFYIIH